MDVLAARLAQVERQMALAHAPVASARSRSDVGIEAAATGAMSAVASDVDVPMGGADSEEEGSALTVLA